MTISTRQAIKIARDTAKEAGYKASVSDTNYDEDEDEYEIELAEDDVIITVVIDGETGDVVEFTTD